MQLSAPRLKKCGAGFGIIVASCLGGVAAARQIGIAARRYAPPARGVRQPANHRLPIRFDGPPATGGLWLGRHRAVLWGWGNLYLWNTRNGRTRLLVGGRRNHYKRIIVLGAFLVGSGRSGKVLLVSSLRASAVTQGVASPWTIAVLREDRMRVRGAVRLHFAPEAACYAGSGEGLVLAARTGGLWQWKGRGRPRRLAGFSHTSGTGPLGLASAPDAGRLAVACGGRIRIYKNASTRPLCTLRLPRGRREVCMAFLPNGKQLAVVDTSERVAVWSTKHGALVRRFPGRYLLATSIAPSPDGRRLALAHVSLPGITTAGRSTGTCYGWLTVLNARSGAVEFRTKKVHQFAFGCAWSPRAHHLIGAMQLQSFVWSPPSAYVGHKR